MLDRHISLLFTLITFLYLSCGLPCPADDTIPENLKKYYSAQPGIIAYPKHTECLHDNDNLGCSNRDFLYRLRMGRIYIPKRFAREDAVAAVTALKNKGFNAAITEQARYILRDEQQKKDPARFWVLDSPDLKELIASCRRMSDLAHKNNMRFFLHLTYNMVDEDIAKRHPDWMVRNIETGEICKNRYGTYTACINNTEFFQFWIERFNTLAGECNTDGIMVDEVQFYDPSTCACDVCKSEFKKQTGLELPVTKQAGNHTNPVYQKWMTWRADKVLERQKAISSSFKQINPKGICLSYQANPLNTDKKLLYAGARYDTMYEFADSIGHEMQPPPTSGYGWLYHYYLHSLIYEMKYNAAAAKPTDNGYWSIFYEQRSTDQFQQGCDLRDWFVSLSQGSRLWYIQYRPEVHPQQLEWEKRHGDLLVNANPVATIGIPVSISSQTWMPRRKDQPDWIVSFSSLCTALQESHIPHKIITERSLDSGSFADDTNVLALMNTSAISDEAIASVTSFVKNGGTVILSGESSLYDPWGNKRKNFGLSELIGASYNGVIPPKAILAVDQPNKVTGTFTGSLSESNAFVNLSDIAEDVEILGQYKTAAGETYPGLLYRKYGKGKMVYFAGYPESKYFIDHHGINRITVHQPWKDMRDKNYLSLISAMMHEVDTNMPLRVDNLPAGVMADILRQDYSNKSENKKISGYQVHLVNLLDRHLETGVIPPPPALRFPSVKENLPDKTKPITIKVKSSGIKGVYMITPDFDEIVEIPFKTSGMYTQAEIPTFYRYSMMYFVEDGLDIIRKLAGKKFVNELPACVSIKPHDPSPLSGRYDPRDMVFFADSPKYSGGLQIDMDALPIRLIYGTQSQYNKVTLTFDLEEVNNHYLLDMGAKDDGSSFKAPIRIRINNTPLAEWKNDFPDGAWAVKSIQLPTGVLKQGKNQIVMENTGIGPKGQPPWLAVTFLRLKKQVTP